jgi:citrate/tricarballylate utilization protein
MFTNERPPLPPEGQVISLDLLVTEGRRQLNICNSCRYCEGFCAVYPALERRTLLDQGDLSQLANLCHDCRACFDACMYTEPHEFAMNVPKALSAVRTADYRRYAWPARVPRVLSGWAGVFSSITVASVIIILIALLQAGPGALIESGDTPASPYRLISYPVLLILVLVPSVFSAVVAVVAARRYWKEVNVPRRPTSAGAIRRAVWYAATLRYLRGGGAECYYPERTTPSALRRRLHSMVAYGFGLCVVSTVAAGVMQDIIGSQPPYGWDSVPVICGTVGGVGLIIGCTSLLLLKARADEVTSFAQMTVKDYALLTGLTFLALSGLATLLTRDTAAFGIFFLIHLASVMVTFAAAPYSKLMHMVYRFLAIVRDNVEKEDADQVRRDQTARA